MLTDGILGIFLHTGIDGRIYFQTIRIQIIKFAIGFFVLVTPTICRICFPSNRIFPELLHLPSPVVFTFGFLRRQKQAQIFAEIRSQSFLVVHTAKMEREWQSFQRITFRLRYIAGFLHLLQNRIAPSACPLVMASGIKIRGVLTHSDKCRRFLDLQRLGCLSEINTGSRLDSHSII